ncbi:hypothetical protein, partial [Dolichospermum circinale]|uniref:hypothetical protein n=1 Tax=Dolichospermum circinale TaxID=109265 RepID=UPI003A8FD443
LFPVSKLSRLLQIGINGNERDEEVRQPLKELSRLLQIGINGNLSTSYFALEIIISFPITSNRNYWKPKDST